MVSWTTILLLGGTAVAVGAIAAYTKAGEGLRGVAGGLAEFVAAPIREGARAVGEIGLGVQQLGGGVGGAFAGIRSEFQAWIDMINKWQGVRPPYIEPGGCRPANPDGSCPTDQAYGRVNGECCWGKSLEARRQGARTQIITFPYNISTVPNTSTVPNIRAPCEPNILPGYGQVGWKSGNVGFGNLADCEAWRAGAR